MSDVIKAYKGFNKDMTCKGFQYEEGREYETDKSKSCEYGFHACEYPLDCLAYYNPAESVYHEVEQSGELDRTGGDSKVASTRIKIGASINIAGLVKAAIEYTTKRVKKEFDSCENYGASSATGVCGASSATGNCGASTATGNCGASTATGVCGASTATGNYGASSATGNYGASSATGVCGASSATGNCGASTATGVCGASTATGNCGASTATGNYGASSATGNYGASTATGVCGASSATGVCGASSVTGYKGASSVEAAGSVAVAWGYKSKAKGVKGSYLVFADWEGNEEEYWKPDTWKLKGAKMVQVDGEMIKENTWYIIEDGEVKESEE